MSLGPGHVRLSEPDLRVEPGLGAHRLSLHFGVEIADLPEGSTILLSGHAQLEDRGWFWLGDLVAEEHLPVMLDAYPRTVMMAVALSDAQVAAIEDRRQGRDVHLLLTVRAVLAGARDIPFPSGAGQGGVHVTSAVWSTLMERLGALVAVPVLVPLPLGDPSSLKSAAGGHLQTALRALADGRTRDALRDARSAMEILDQIEPRHPWGGLPKPEERDLTQRFAALRETVRSVAHGASHQTPVTAEFTYSRADAVAVVACVAALLQRVSRTP